MLLKNRSKYSLIRLETQSVQKIQKCVIYSAQGLLLASKYRQRNVSFVLPQQQGFDKA